MEFHIHYWSLFLLFTSFMPLSRRVLLVHEHVLILNCIFIGSICRCVSWVPYQLENHYHVLYQSSIELLRQSLSGAVCGTNLGQRKTKNLRDACSTKVQEQSACSMRDQCLEAAALPTGHAELGPSLLGIAYVEMPALISVRYLGPSKHISMCLPMQSVLAIPDYPQ